MRGGGGIGPVVPGAIGGRFGGTAAPGGLLGRVERDADCARVSRDADGRCPDRVVLDPARRPENEKPRVIVPPPGSIPREPGPLREPRPVCPPGTVGSNLGRTCTTDGVDPHLGKTGAP